MSEAHAHHENHAQHDTHHGNYVKIWAILCVLLIISFVGPMLEIRALTLLTAFGIAIVKAYMVAKNFMHVTVQRKYIVYLVTTCLVFLMLFFAGVSPDVMKAEGNNWKKPSWLAEAAAPAPEGGAHGGEGPDGHP